MDSYEFNDYSMEISSGETLKIVEIIPELVSIEEFNKLPKHIHSLIPQVPKEIMESAKIGDDRQFIKLLKTQPIGCLLKIEKKRCVHSKNCAMYDEYPCTISIKRKYLNLCWDSENGNLATEIIRHWRNNTNVIYVTK